MKRRIGIVAFERERTIRRTVGMSCPVCRLESELLTVRQAAALAQVGAKTIYRWLARGGVHGLRTPGGGHRICRESLFVLQPEASQIRVLDMSLARYR
jgi:excisionase family DNA binding protein